MKKESKTKKCEISKEELFEKIKRKMMAKIRKLSKKEQKEKVAAICENWDRGDSEAERLMAALDLLD